MAARKKATKKSAKAKKKPPARKIAGAGIRIKRAYDDASPGDGLRILIDRLWPRGLSKDNLKLDAWVKHLAPSNELRKWYQHDPAKFSEFRRRYVAELKSQDDGLNELRQTVKGRVVTLLTATKELDLSHAQVLRDLLTKRR